MTSRASLKRIESKKRTWKMCINGSRQRSTLALSERCLRVQLGRDKYKGDERCELEPAFATVRDY